MTARWNVGFVVAVTLAAIADLDRV